MTVTTLYKDKYGKTYRLNDLGKKYIDENWENKPINEIAKVIGLSDTSIKYYMKKKGYFKRLVGKDYKEFQDKVVSLLKPYNGKLQYIEMMKVLSEKHNINLTRDQLYQIVKDTELETPYGDGNIRVFIDGDKNNLEPNNIVVLSTKEHKYLLKMVDLNETTGDTLLAAIQLARFKVAKNSVKELYTATNIKTGEVIKSNYKTVISEKITNRRGQYDDCKKIGKNGERYMRDWIVERKIIGIS